MTKQTYIINWVEEDGTKHRTEISPCERDACTELQQRVMESFDASVAHDKLVPISMNLVDGSTIELVDRCGSVETEVISLECKTVELSEEEAKVVRKRFASLKTKK